MEKPVEGGYHWQSGSHVAEWLARLPELEPQRAAAFDAILALLPRHTDKPLSVLDLGAGAGALAGVIMARYPLAHATLADFSQPMIEAGTAALSGFAGRFHYVTYDMNAQPWPAELAGPFNAVVSSQAIHHLPNERKAWLFRQVYDHLTSGGVFANWDPFRKPGEHHHHEPGDGEHEGHLHRHDHDRTLATIDDQCEMLRLIGYADVAIVDQTPESALLAGRKT